MTNSAGSYLLGTSSIAVGTNTICHGVEVAAYYPRWMPALAVGTQAPAAVAYGSYIWYLANPATVNFIGIQSTNALYIVDDLLGGNAPSGLTFQKRYAIGQGLTKFFDSFTITGGVQDELSSGALMED